MQLVVTLNLFLQPPPLPADLREPEPEPPQDPWTDDVRRAVEGLGEHFHRDELFAALLFGEVIQTRHTLLRVFKILETLGYRTRLWHGEDGVFRRYWFRPSEGVRGSAATE